MAQVASVVDPLGVWWHTPLGWCWLHVNPWKDSVCWVFAALSQKGFRQNPDVLPTDASCDKAEVGKDEHDIESLVWQ